VRLLITLASAATIALGAFAAGSGSGFQDPLEAAAQPTRFTATTHLSAVARAGNRLVAVGVRGLIVLSDDQGASWRQAASPVSSDLVTVRFISERRGWAAGHDGVILTTDDGGERWVKQLDGRMAARQLVAHFDKLVASGQPNAERMRKEVVRNYENGPEMPVLDLWFESEQVGWAAGPFGTLLGTRDGGKTWVSWIEKVDSDKMPHYNAVRGIAGELYLASEQGTLFRLDRARGRFVALATGYQGSFFGVVGTAGNLIAYGLRGTAYRSRNGGASWQRLDTGVPAGLTGATLLEDGRLLFVSQDGRLLMSRDQGDSFEALPVARPGLFTDVAAAAPGRIVITGLRGVQSAALP